MDARTPANATPPWYAPWRGQDQDHDAADLGTAFGLDLSLAPGQEPTPAQVSASQAKDWMQKLYQRRRSQAD